MDHSRPKKRFGQHFLHDRRVIERIIAAFGPRPNDLVVEIGPGRGVLTRELTGRVARLHAVELDRDLAARLQTEFTPDSVIIHCADALEFDFRRLREPGRPLRLIGNLPYNISTPLLFHLLGQLDGAGSGGPAIHDMLFMLQKEVAERLCATPGGRDYGRLSVMIQSRCRAERLFPVPSGAFTPPPKVASTVVRLRPYETPPVRIDDADGFALLVKSAFAQRRKTLRNSLKGLLGPEEMAALGIDPGRRAETLSIEEFATLANRAANPFGS